MLHLSRRGENVLNLIPGKLLKTFQLQKSIDLQINMFDDGITTKCVFCPYGKVLAGNGQTYLMFDSSSKL